MNTEPKTLDPKQLKIQADLKDYKRRKQDLILETGCADIHYIEWSPSGAIIKERVVKLDDNQLEAVKNQIEEQRK
jgi:hypothetical protein